MVKNKNIEGTKEGIKAKLKAILQFNKKRKSAIDKISKSVSKKELKNM